MSRRFTTYRPPSQCACPLTLQHASNTAATANISIELEMQSQDEANAPLIEDREHEEGSLKESDTTSPSAFIWALTFTAGISGLLFGYDTGVISSTLVSIGDDLGHPLSALDKGLITSCTSLGALIVSPITGLLCDNFGRRPIILAADILFIIGALSQAAVITVSGMVVGRTIVGFAVGGASLVVPLYISELAPSAFRGKLVTVSVLFITFGQVVAYLIGYALSRQIGGWRWMVGLGATPAIIQFGLMLLLPESPRWLAKAGRTQEARKVLRRVYAAGKDAVVEEVLRAIRMEIADEESISDDVSVSVEGSIGQAWTKRMRNRCAKLFSVGGNRRALNIACLLQGLQQLCGFVCFAYLYHHLFANRYRIH